MLTLRARPTSLGSLMTTTPRSTLIRDRATSRYMFMIRRDYRVKPGQGLRADWRKLLKQGLGRVHIQVGREVSAARRYSTSAWTESELGN